MKLTVVKIGGNVIDDENLLKAFLKDFSQLPSPKILIHGGGKIATQIAKKLSIETVMIEGRRVTDQAMLDVVTMVYGGLVNKKIVAQMQSLQNNAIGLTGADGGAVLSQKRNPNPIDYGYVGDIKTVNVEFINSLLLQNIVPVFAPLTHDNEGNILNTNADTQAQAIAQALTKLYEVTLVYCFEKKGVLRDINDENSVITHINPEIYQNLKSENVIFEGMIPKLDNAFKAINEGVQKVLICHAEAIKTACTHQPLGTLLQKN
ncbi:MAG: acetylglutamate kinase [Pseudarcicella sp.]|jgi:acetylglutamate kinase|nr:acetylglutamate kinase [Pseudarcicella sp.]